MQDSSGVVKLSEPITMWKVVAQRRRDGRGMEFRTRAILELQVPAGAYMHWSLDKCRCSKAFVVAAYKWEDLDFMHGMHIKCKGNHDFNEYFSIWVYRQGTSPFYYKVNDAVSCDDFDFDDCQCSRGIHCFRTKQEAIEYGKTF
jgi:hypothetical protein